MPNIATTEPACVTAGDTVQWLKSLPDYPADDGWVLGYVLINAASKITLGSTASGADHLVGATAAASAAWASGAYEWQARVSRSGEVFTVGRGRMQVLPSLSAATTLDTRSSARRGLEAVEAYMADGNNIKAAGYTIAGRTLNRYTLADLIALKSHLQAEVVREDAAASLAAGLPDKRRIYVRFGP
jgi:hypothetical protein